MYTKDKYAISTIFFVFIFIIGIVGSTICLIIGASGTVFCATTFIRLLKTGDSTFDSWGCGLGLSTFIILSFFAGFLFSDKVFISENNDKQHLYIDCPIVGDTIKMCGTTEFYAICHACYEKCEICENRQKREEEIENEQNKEKCREEKINKLIEQIEEREELIKELKDAANPYQIEIPSESNGEEDDDEDNFGIPSRYM